MLSVRRASRSLQQPPMWNLLKSKCFFFPSSKKSHNIFEARWKNRSRHCVPLTWHLCALLSIRLPVWWDTCLYMFFLSCKTESNIQRIATPFFGEKIQAEYLNERTGWKEQREALILCLRHLAYTHGAAVLTGGRWLISWLCKALITTSDIGGAGWGGPHGDTML